MNILLTGSSGFIGRNLLDVLLSAEHTITAPVRKKLDNSDPKIKQVVINGITKEQNWQPVMKGQDVVIHSAARVHIMDDNSHDPLEEYRKVNVEGTLNLARQAAHEQVKRFIFISSIKVNGEKTTPGNPFFADDTPKPIDPYGISKFEAEEGLKDISAQTGMEIVIIRPVLVYGPGVKANFQNMMKWINRGIPLPLGAINNRRSLVAIDNLVDLIKVCIDHPAAANQIFLVSDDTSLSTSELLRSIKNALNKSSIIIPVHSHILLIIAKIFRKEKLISRLLESLEVDISKTKTLLNWRPPVSIYMALQKTANYFLDDQKK